MRKEKNLSIELLKFIAVLLITNSHFDDQYVYFKELATGGAIGDALFFFCSGYTLFLGRLDSFDSWYKRRIRRIYPSVFSFAILSAFIFGIEQRIDNIIMYGGGWFVSCIMIYYVILYFVRKYAIDKISWIFAITIVITLIWYFFYYEDITYSIYKSTYIKWCFFFLTMLLGAVVGMNKNIKQKNEELAGQIIQNKTWINIIKFTISLVLFYGIQLLWQKLAGFEYLQIISVIPLLFVCYYLYRICNEQWVERFFNKKLQKIIVCTVSGLCLEIYLVQPAMRTTTLNFLFPFNLFVIFLFIVIAAYICRSFARIFQQTFCNEDGYNWKEIFRLI